MGEPLNNYAAVKAAVAMLTDSRVFALRRNKVTVSTVGVVPRVLQLSEDLPGVSLAVSLHAPTQASPYGTPMAVFHICVNTAHSHTTVDRVSPVSNVSWDNKNSNVLAWQSCNSV